MTSKNVRLRSFVVKQLMISHPVVGNRVVVQPLTIQKSCTRLHSYQVTFSWYQIVYFFHFFALFYPDCLSFGTSTFYPRDRPL